MLSTYWNAHLVVDWFQDLIGSLPHSACQKESYYFIILNQQYANQKKNMIAYYTKCFMVVTIP